MLKNIFKILFYSITFIAVGMVAAFLVYKILNFDKTGEVPVLVGKSITEASELLNKRKLFLNIKGKEHNNEVPEGYILEQDVESGKEIVVNFDYSK